MSEASDLKAPCEHDGIQVTMDARALHLCMAMVLKRTERGCAMLVVREISGLVDKLTAPHVSSRLGCVMV